MNTDSILKNIYKLEDKNYNFAAVKMWEKVLEYDPKVFNQLRYADNLRLCGFFSKAEKVLQSIDIEEIPKDYKYNYFIYLGDLYKDQGKFYQAQNNYLRAVQLNPNSTIPYVFLSSVLIEDKDLDEAIKYLKIALTKEGDIDEVNYNLAKRLAIKGEFERALIAITDCLKDDPNYPNAKDFKNDLVEFLKINET